MKKDRKYWRDKANNFIKNGAVDTALVFLSKGWSAVASGPVGWMAERILEYVWDKTAGKMVRLGLRKGWLVVDLASGAIKIKKINKAKDENNSDDYWDTISDI